MREATTSGEPVVMKIILAGVALGISLPVLAQQSGVKVTFSPESTRFEEAARQYQAIWDADGERIVATMERVSGLKFMETKIQAVIFEGVSHSGSVDSPMKLRASYPVDVKKATLVHELGHRLSFQLRFYLGTQKELDGHRILYLYLYDVWVSLYGQSFADQQVEVEKSRTVPAAFRWLAGYDYRAAWEWALRLTATERSSKLREVISRNETARRLILRITTRDTRRPIDAMISAASGGPRKEDHGHGLRVRHHCGCIGRCHE